MSNIYITEPPTAGKVVLTTNYGDLEIELWSKEARKACRNFVQLCMEGYYDGTIFHRVIKDFMIQGGDPTGTGEGGESAFGDPFQKEIHSRLRFNHRGLVAMAGESDLGSQFFVTFAACPWLDRKHTIFGKVFARLFVDQSLLAEKGQITGNTVFNLSRMNELEVDESHRPTYPPSTIRTTIVWNPFDDIIPRHMPGVETEQCVVPDRKKTSSQRARKKDFTTLSFGDEAEEDEEQLSFQKHTARSSHDVLSDPRLSGSSAANVESVKKVVEESSSSESEDGMEDDKSPIVSNVQVEIQKVAKDVRAIGEGVEQMDSKHKKRRGGEKRRSTDILGHLAEFQRSLRSKSGESSWMDHKLICNTRQDNERDDYSVHDPLSDMKKSLKQPDSWDSRRREDRDREERERKRRRHQHRTSDTK